MESETMSARELLSSGRVDALLDGLRNSGWVSQNTNEESDLPWRAADALEAFVKDRIACTPTLSGDDVGQVARAIERQAFDIADRICPSEDQGERDVGNMIAFRAAREALALSATAAPRRDAVCPICREAVDEYFSDQREAD